MILTTKIQAAIDLAADMHQGKFRKGEDNKRPYIVHPFGVAWIVANYTKDEDIICAALLHDVLEDVGGRDTYTEIVNNKLLGKRIAQIVKDVSEDKDPNIISDEKATWPERKRKYIEHLSHVDDSALLVSAADKIHNLISMFQSYQEVGDNLWSRFNAKPQDIRWYYGEVLSVIKSRLANPIVQEYQSELDKADKLWKWK